MTTDTSSNSSLILNLVSDFLNKILERDSNFTTYLKQWDSFRQVLTSALPTDLATIYSHIAGISLVPTTSPGANKPFRSRPSALGEIYNDFKPHIGSFTPEPSSYSGFSNYLNSADRPHRRVYSFDENDEVEVKKVGGFKPSLFSLNINNGSDTAATADTAGASLLSKDLLLSDRTVRDESPDFINDFVKSPSYTLKDISTVAVSVNKPYGLSSLADMARKMKNNVERNSEAIIGQKETTAKVEPGSYAQPEVRSPLRRLTLRGGKSPLAQGSEFEKKVTEVTASPNYGLDTFSIKLF